MIRYTLVGCFIIIIISGQLACSASQECPFLLNDSGEFIVNGKKIQNLEELKNHGASFSKLSKIPTAEEGEMWQKDVIYENRICMSIEYDKKEVYRFIIYNDLIPLVTRTGIYIRVGNTLEELSKIGNINENFGEDPGMYLTVDGLNNLSFYTKCSSLPFEMTPEKKSMSREKFYASCQINKILAWGSAK